MRGIARQLLSLLVSGAVVGSAVVGGAGGHGVFVGGAALGALIVGGVAMPQSAWAFDPNGRKRKKAPRRKASRRIQRAKSSSSPSRPTGSRGARAQSEAERQAALITRYTVLALAQPGVLFPLQRLATLARQRDGALEQLLVSFESRAAVVGQGQYSATIALAGLYAQAQRFLDSEKAYERAIALNPKAAPGLLGLGHLKYQQQHLKPAIELFERALPVLKTAAESEATLRLLLTLCLDVDDLQSARRHHQRLIKNSKGSFFVRAELARELLTRQKYPAAEQEYRRLVKLASGDHRALAPLLRDLGRVLSKLSNYDEALSVLRRASRSTPRNSGLQREILNVVVQVHRESGRLAELVVELEKQSPSDFERARLLASLYEESGRIADAIRLYRRVVKSRPSAIETRLKLVRLLQIQGELTQVISEYAALVKVAPANADFVFQLADVLLQQGRRAEALTLLAKSERRFAADEQILAALVDFLERMGESARAKALLTRLANTPGGDPEHVIALGNRFYQEGKTKRAQQVWQRLLNVSQNKAKAHHALGGVYLEHDLIPLALVQLRQAVKLDPQSLLYKKALAVAFERAAAGAAERVQAQRYQNAQEIWEQLLSEPGQRPAVAREAIQHLVSLWALRGTLRDRVRPLERSLAKRPPDLRSGRLLAEVYFRLGRYAESERTLQTITELSPGDVQSYLRLERVLTLQSKLPEAIEVLKKLAKVDPSKARIFYQRMAQYSAELYQDDDAITFASRAVELSPDDASGHKKLGEMYRRRQDTALAIGEFRKAIAKNERLYPVHIALAELLISTGQVAAADKLLRRVMRSATDEQLIAHATHLSIQLNVTAGTLDSLEKELLPLALSRGHTRIYRRLLVEIYAALASPLIAVVAGSNGAASARASAQLESLGVRAVKPLLDVLNDRGSGKQQVALSLLTHFRNKGAVPALLAYAMGQAAPELRTKAMLAAGAVRDERVFDKWVTLLAPNDVLQIDEEDTVAMAAVWAVVQLKSPKARRFKLRLLTVDAPSVRALAAVSLALDDEQAAASSLLSLLDSNQESAEVRAAAAFALGLLKDKRAVPGLKQLANDPDPLAQALALAALIQVGASDSAPILGRAMVGRDQKVRAAAWSGARSSAPTRSALRRRFFALPAERVVIALALEQLLPPTPPATEMAQAFLAQLDSITQACVDAAEMSPEGAVWIAQALDGRAPPSSFLPRLGGVAPELKKAVKVAFHTIRGRVLPTIISLAKHPALKFRLVALTWLARHKSPEAQAVAVSALRDGGPEVKEALLTVIANRPRPAFLLALSQVLASDVSWPQRAAAADALGAFSLLPPDQAEAVLGALTASALGDRYALVRESAAKALFRLQPIKSAATLRRVIQADIEPRVRSELSAFISSNGVMP